jgi:uncharacterized membrane protein
MLWDSADDRVGHFLPWNAHISRATLFQGVLVVPSCREKARVGGRIGGGRLKNDSADVNRGGGGGDNFGPEMP